MQKKTPYVQKELQSLAWYQHELGGTAGTVWKDDKQDREGITDSGTVLEVVLICF